MPDTQYDFYIIVQHKMIINDTLLKANNIPYMHTEIGPSFYFSSKMKCLCPEYARSSYLQVLHNLPTSSLPTFITGHSSTVPLTCRHHEPLAVPQIWCLSGLSACRGNCPLHLGPPFASFLLGEFVCTF